MLERGLLQHRKRPTYYSPSSRTALAEAELSYDDNHKSQSVYVYFKVPGDGMSTSLAQLVKDVAPGEEVGLAIWTTTAWTLPANMAVLAGEDIDYCLARQQNSGRILVVAEARLEDLQARLGALKVLGRMSGRSRSIDVTSISADSPRRQGAARHAIRASVLARRSASIPGHRLYRCNDYGRHGSCPFSTRSWQGRLRGFPPGL